MRSSNITIMDHVFTIFRRQPTNSVLHIAPRYEYTIHYYQKSLGILRIGHTGIWVLELRFTDLSYAQSYITGEHKSKTVKAMILDFILTNFNEIIK